MQFHTDGHIVDSSGVIPDICQTWLDLYADLYRETHEEFATVDEIIADADLRFQVITRSDVADPDDPDYFVGPIEYIGK